MNAVATVDELESALLDDASVDLGWRLVERFAGLVRESGSADEHAAAEWIVARLAELGIEHEVYEPQLYLSLPRRASVAWGDGRRARAKPPSFAAPTPPEGVTAEALYVPAPPIDDVTELFADRAQDAGGEVEGRIVVSDGFPMPAVVRRFEEAGAAAQIYVNPGRNVHWGICTPIWGTPSDGDLEHKPRTPVVAISRPDGDALLAHLEGDAVAVTVHAALEEGWYPCKLPVATIRGRSDDYLLVHGHYDSWDVGIGDNAVGDAILLELARLFHRHRRHLRRTLKVAWWPGHSTGRYAGSTWFADRFALELRRHCVAAVNVDSPGCAGATAFEDVMWMAEADALCRRAIADRTGESAERRRPIRAGDYSFNQLGVTSFFMLLSSIPKAIRRARGYYPVGGCGGNVAWHTEDDVLEVADRGILEQDLKIYLTAIARVLNAPVLPFDYRLTAAELRRAVEDYAAEAEELLDLGPIGAALDRLDAALARLYRRIAASGSAEAGRFDAALKQLARVLVHVGYCRGDAFEHDPALPLGAIPALDDVAKLRRYRRHLPQRLPFLQAGLRRRVNRVAAAVGEAARIAEHAAGS